MIHANGIDINVYSKDFKNDYISLTDIAKKREGESGLCDSKLDEK